MGRSVEAVAVSALWWQLRTYDTELQRPQAKLQTSEEEKVTNQT